MTEGPVGELEDLIARAFAQGPETLSAQDAALYLAEQLAPHVVLRDQLEHVGWLLRREASEDGPAMNEITTHLGLTGEGLRAVFTIPPRTVQGGANLVLQFGAGASDD